jgi:hypothetical protein
MSIPSAGRRQDSPFSAPGMLSVADGVPVGMVVEVDVMVGLGVVVLVAGCVLVAIDSGVINSTGETSGVAVPQAARKKRMIGMTHKEFFIF